MTLNHGYLGSDTLHPGGFSSQDNYEKAVAEFEERKRQEAVRSAEHRQWEEANRQSLEQAEKELPTTSKFDWMALDTLDDHPLMVKATADVTAAKERLEAAGRSLSQAQATLRAAEDVAARGRPNDAALTQARSGIDAATSEQRIAARAVELAEANATAVYRAVNAACAANLTRLHDEAAAALNAALGQAQMHSQRAAAIEDKSHQILPHSIYAPKWKRVGSPVRLLAWRKEFGPHGYLAYWRHYFKMPG
jgi:hypothetical protein